VFNVLLSENTPIEMINGLTSINTVHDSSVAHGCFMFGMLNTEQTGAPGRRCEIMHLHLLEVIRI